MASTTSLATARLTPRAKLRVPLGGQEIELQQVEFEAGGMSPARPPVGAHSLSEGPGRRPEGAPLSLLRVRIREGHRFTVFDVDPGTAAAWGEALVRWAREQGEG